MAEVLSQSQIDALMKEMRSGNKAEKKNDGGAGEKKYRKYDFYSPKKITKDKIKLLKGIYDNYARIASSRLNGVLRVSSEIEVLSVEEQRFYEFSNALSENDIVMTQTLVLPNKSQSQPILMHMNQPPMLAMIDRMLGGDGADADAADSNYSYTDLEIELYKKIMGYFLDFTKDAWSNYIVLETEKTVLEENPALFQEISLDETIAIIILNIKVGEIEGKISICIPRSLLTEIFGIIDSKKHIGEVQDSDRRDSRQFILSKIKESVLTVKAEMGTVEIPIRDIHNLKTGDIINLEKPQNSEIYLNIGGKPWLKGKLGIYNKDAAILINGRVDREETEKEEEAVPAE
ncbi:flagellar motor switch protein FliM [Mediterraneibacter sp. NSJ-55]|uniref:Flagellar motor switch protein FliM n=1 Tax=Mediterraneibacter hominis TaxID=2763054 RepID=A0A923LJD0_9FIRM|nr:FliM/FliN family flagellar motor switch protein [Mediterraneibacter hominis]MBC5689345.1 flagellar motor switch protein FliM [Mediterraneibacter hominis]